MDGRLNLELERGLRLLEQRAALLAEAELAFEQRVLVAAEQLASEMVLEARLERNAARRLQKRLDDLNSKVGSLMNPRTHLTG
jgi:hypothetical protein